MMRFGRWIFDDGRSASSETAVMYEVRKTALWSYPAYADIR